MAKELQQGSQALQAATEQIHEIVEIPADASSKRSEVDTAEDSSPRCRGASAATGIESGHARQTPASRASISMPDLLRTGLHERLRTKRNLHLPPDRTAHPPGARDYRGGGGVRLPFSLRQGSLRPAGPALAGSLAQRRADDRHRRDHAFFRADESRHDDGLPDFLALRALSDLGLHRPWPV